MLAAPAFQLPPPPPGFHRFAWQGLALLLPQEWNLTRHEGDGRRGALVFADLRATRLLVRWKTPGHFLRPQTPAAALQRTRTRLKDKPSTPGWLPPESILLCRPGSTLALFGDARRLYELEWPESDPSHETILRDFSHLIPQHAAASAWPWQLYGLSAWLPPAARLTHSSLLPGQTSLTFALGSARVHLNSHSLADRLLHDASLHDWATRTIPLLKTHPGGTWQQSASALRYHVHLPGKLLRRPRLHHLTVTLDPVANQIHWTHTIQRAKTPQASPIPVAPPAAEPL